MKSSALSPQLVQDGDQRHQEQFKRQCVRRGAAREYVRDHLQAKAAENLGRAKAQQQLAAFEKQITKLEYLVASVAVVGQDNAEQGWGVPSALTPLTELASGSTLRVRSVSPAEVGGAIDGSTQVAQSSPVGNEGEGCRVREPFRVQIGPRHWSYQVTLHSTPPTLQLPAPSRWTRDRETPLRAA